MPPEQHKQIPATAEVVDLDSSDEEGETANGKPSNSEKSRAQPPATATQPVSAVTSGGASAVNNEALESRSFWRAGAYEIGTTKSTLIQGDLEHARVHPKFLHSNATSHKWAFGAIAELLDNAVDEVANGATFVKVDRIYNSKDNSPVLLFQDDGGGMDPEKMRKCMSLGYSSKTSNTTIGQYGNGFKTSTMRLGADVIVFSRSNRFGRATQSIGLLSYTFLRRTRQNDVTVQMIDFDISDNWPEPIIYRSKDDWYGNLKTILEWSPFASKDDLMLQFANLGSHGTKILIYNLWMNDQGIYELNFDDDHEAIAISIGFTKEAPEVRVCGFNVYHRSRLIRPYWTVTAPGHYQGSGVIGVLEANFIKPAHDKQDFERSTLFIRLESRLKQIVNEYWKGHCHLVGYQPYGVKKSSEAPVSRDAFRTIVNQNSASPGTELVCFHSAELLDATELSAIYEENIQLFMRCDAYKKKQAKMTLTIEGLEKELEEMRAKCARVSSQLVIQRNEAALVAPR